MTKLTLILLISFIFSTHNEVISESLNDLVYYKGLYYKKISDDPFSVSDIPFSGKVTGEYQGSFEKGKQEGPWVYNPGNGLLHKGNYENGRREGVWVSFYNNGETASIGNYKDGKKDGLWKDFIDTGVLSNVGNFKDGEYEGLWKRFYRNGKLNYSREVPFLFGLL